MMAMFGLPQGGELVIILLIVLVLFGPSRLPKLGKSLGKTMKAIREGVDGSGDDDDDDVPAPKKAKKAAAADVEDDDEE